MTHAADDYAAINQHLKNLSSPQQKYAIGYGHWVHVIGPFDWCRAHPPKWPVTLFDTAEEVRVLIDADVQIMRAFCYPKLYPASDPA